MKKGGRLLAGLDCGLNFAFDEDGALTHKLPFDPLADEELARECLAKNEGYQFSHTVEEQVGGQLEAGFDLRAIFGDRNGYGKMDEYGIETNMATMAVKR